MTAPAAARVPYAISLLNVRTHFWLGWRAQGTPEWRRWRAWTSVRNALADAIASRVAGGFKPEPEVVDLYRRIARRCDEVRPE